MPIKTILVYLPSLKAAGNILPAALNIAATWKAHAIGLHVSQTVPLYAEMTAELPPDVYEQLGEAVRKNEEAVRQAFEAFA
ncbi:MAG: hypothetical protein WBX25_37130, partial [Rhodomicrobium sp.]